MSVEPAHFLRRDGPLAPFGIPSFRRLWAAGVLFSLGQVMERTAIGWFVLDATGSVFLTALAWAVRSIPNSLLRPDCGRSRGPLLAPGLACSERGCSRRHRDRARYRRFRRRGSDIADPRPGRAERRHDDSADLRTSVAGRRRCRTRPPRQRHQSPLVRGPLHGGPRGPCERLSDRRNWCTADLPFRRRTARIRGAAVRLRAFPGAHAIERQALCRCARGAADDRSRPDRRAPARADGGRGDPWLLLQRAPPGRCRLAPRSRA